MGKWINPHYDPGCYIIVCPRLVRAYVGASKWVPRRFAQHRDLLAKGKHPLRRLQLDWNVMGSAAFLFERVEDIAPLEINALIGREIEYIMAFGGVFDLYNTERKNGRIRWY